MTQCHNLSENEDKRMESLFGVFAKRIFVTDEKYVNVPTYRHWRDRYKQFDCRQSDVWVVSYPKSGTTWTQEMVWCILNNFDYATAKKDLLMKRFPFFEWDGLLPEDQRMFDPLPADDPCAPGEQWKILHTLEDPRTIKSHLHLEMLPDTLITAKPKIIYVCRDPRDVCVSYYYHSRKLDGFVGNFDEFFDLFLEDLHFFSPYWKHILDFWKIRHLENVFFIRYEDLKNDLAGSIKRLATFLNKNIPEDKMGPFMDHLSFDKMKSNAAVNNEAIMPMSSEDNQKIPFMRNGKIGDWKSHFSIEQIEKMKKWTEDSLNNSDFPYYREY